MGTAKAKPIDKSQVCRRLVQSLQKLYGKSVPASRQESVLDTMLFAVCLEDNRWEQADAGLKRLNASFFDLNEIRVSSVTELERALEGLAQPDWKGVRIRAILRHVFEGTYTFEFEKLRRMTLEQAIKALKKIQELSPFVRDYVLHEILGNHVVCLDNLMLTAARWLGLVSATADINEASESLKTVVRKAEVSEFCHLLKCLSTDPKFVDRLSEPLDRVYTMADVAERIVALQLPKPAPKPVSGDGPKPPSSPGKKNESVKPGSKGSGSKVAAGGAEVQKPPKGAGSAEKTEKSAVKKKPATAGKGAATGAKTASGKAAAGSGKAAAAPSKGSSSTGKSAGSKSASGKGRR